MQNKLIMTPIAIARRKWRNKNHEKHRKYDRAYRARHPLRARKSSRMAGIKYRGQHPERKIAQSAVANAVRDGRLIRPNKCSACMKSCKPEAHHPDYQRKLYVRWLCESCHTFAHKDQLPAPPGQEGV
jgi:hypothetical protein